ncbi:hypothetical protein KKHLCK_06750 [Candidatus Electrothrix laxa]
MAQRGNKTRLKKKMLFEIQFEKAFLEFVEWMRSKEAEEETRKVA